LKQDGNHYPELMLACKEKLKQLDPKVCRSIFPEQISYQDLKRSQTVLNNWVSELKLSDGDESEEFYWKGKEALKSQDYQEAEDFFNLAIELKRISRYLVGRAEARKCLGNVAGAVSDCEEAIRLDGNFEEVSNLLDSLVQKTSHNNAFIENFDSINSGGTSEPKKYKKIMVQEIDEEESPKIEEVFDEPVGKTAAIPIKTKKKVPIEFVD
jgi:tetratricopeptide (TPR) repeat protein